MVEYTLQLDAIFGSLADPTRRDIVRRVTGHEMTVGQIASHYSMSLAAISKHLMILDRAKLIIKRKQGREQLVVANPPALRTVQDFLDEYKRLWDDRLVALEELLKEEAR